MLVHNVFFTLKDSSRSAIFRLVSDCYRYLKDHSGIEFFSAGELAAECDRPVNDRDFHVSLHVVFKDHECQRQYQLAADHLEFIEKNKSNWDKVRVFDSVTAD